MSHPTWELPVENSALILTPCPGTQGVDLKTSLEQIKQQGAVAVVTALGNEEMAEQGVSELGELVEQLGMKWYHIIIEDDAAPDANFAKEWAAASPELHKAIADGGKVCMHCLGGSGRTGLFAAHFLLEEGWELPEIIEKVRALRPGAYTRQVQMDYIQAFAASR